MVRSLIAMLVATFLGLAVAKFTESAGLGYLQNSGEAVSTTGYAVTLLLSWVLASFAACAVALLIVRRWAPVGMLAASTVMFSAIIAMVPGNLPLWLWPASFLAIGLSGWCVIRLMNAQKMPAAPARKNIELFDD